MADGTGSLSMATNSGAPVSGEHDGWKLASASAVRPTEQQIKESLGAPPEEKPATEDTAVAAEVVTEETEGEKPAVEAVADDKTSDQSSEKPVETGAAKPKKLTRADQINLEIKTLTRQKGEITRETEAAKAQRQAIADEIAQLEAKRDALRQPEAAKPAEPSTGARKALNPAPKPVWAEMEAAGKTYEQFLDARDEWNTEEHRLIAREESAKTVQEREKAAREASTRETRERAEADIDAKYQQRLANARLAHPDVDFDAVLDTPLPISPDMPGFKPMGDRIRISDVGPELLLFLTEHPDEARRIAESPWPIALSELGIIEGGIKARTTANSGSVAQPAPSKAHAPIKPVRVAAPVASDASKRSVDELEFGPEYIRQSNRQLGMR